MKKTALLGLIFLLCALVSAEILFVAFPANAQVCRMINCNSRTNVGQQCCYDRGGGQLVNGTCDIQGGFGLCVPSSDPTCGGICSSAQECRNVGGINTCVERPAQQPGPVTPVANEYPNPLPYRSVQELAATILSTLRTVIVVLSIIFIVLGGILYITSAGNEKRMTAAKGSILASLIGFAIGIAAPSFLREIYVLMGGKVGSGIDESQLVGLTLSQIALNFLNFLLAIVGILALIMLIVGGVMYITSAGDDDRVKSAKKIVTYSVIGITVSLAALLLVRQVVNLLR